MLKQLLSIIFSLTCLAGYAQAKDSLNIDLPDSLYQKQLHQLDSIEQHTNQEFGKLKLEYDSIEQKLGGSISLLQYRKDSLANLNLPTDTYTAKIDSLNRIKEAELAAVKSKAEQLKDRSIGKIEKLKLPPEISKETQLFNQGLSKLDVSLPSTDFNFPTIPSLGNVRNLSLPNVNTPDLPGLAIPEVNTSLPQSNIGIEVPAVGEELGQVTEQVSEIKDKVKIPTKEEFGSEIESNVSKIEPLKDATDKMGEVPAMPTSEEAAKEMLVNQAKEQAVNHFAGKEEILQSAMKDISKLKQKYSDVQSIKDLPKKPPNPMKSKPFIERLIPGVAFQILYKNDWSLDVGPYMGYWFNGRINAGLGWNQRFAFTGDYEFNKQARVYGPRAFGEFEITEGIAVRLEVETMNTLVPPLLKPTTSPTEGQREWVPAIIAGFKKDYKIYKRLSGTALLLYNFYNPEYKSPYGDRVIVRFGLEYSFKKTKRK